jgi:hypothetical protein
MTDQQNHTGHGLDHVNQDVLVSETVVSTLPIVDRVETSGGVVVMVRAGGAHRVVRLSQLGAEILDAVGSGITMGALEAVVLDRLGPPPDGDLPAAVRAAVRVLADAGVLSTTATVGDVTQS